MTDMIRLSYDLKVVRPAYSAVTNEVARDSERLKPGGEFIARTPVPKHAMHKDVTTARRGSDPSMTCKPGFKIRSMAGDYRCHVLKQIWLFFILVTDNREKNVFAQLSTKVCKDKMFVQQIFIRRELKYLTDCCVELIYDATCYCTSSV
ncbi:unnamed protein product [Clavelina lepadiformis]|uniref:Uncharacterized protein n=1 Tax=Clavelina lepadiformis TaxID=159417 RepID=A0ABP0FT70_CLALP